MSIDLQLDDEQTRLLEERARQLQVAPHDLAKAAVLDLLLRPAEDFEAAARLVLEKNRELYQRLGSHSDWPPGFFDKFRDLDKETARLFEESMAVVMHSRRSKAPPTF